MFLRNHFRDVGEFRNKRGALERGVLRFGEVMAELKNSPPIQEGSFGKKPRG